MPSRLLACRSCGRHVFASEPKCPFCGNAGPARALASAVTLGASLSLLACDRDAKTATPAAPTATDAAPGPTAAASEAPAPAPTAAADAGLDVLALGEGLSFGERDGGVAGFAGLRTSTGVYGAPQPTGLGALGVRGPKAEVGVLEATSTVPIPNLQRVVASLRGRVRGACQSALTQDPTLDGSIELTLDVAEDGSVSAVTAKAVRLPEGLVANVKGIYQRAQFDAPGKAAKVTSKVTCRPAKE